SGTPCAAAGSTAAFAATTTALLRSLPRRFVLQLGTIRQYERRIPERVPAFLVHALFRQLYPGGAERARLVHAETADAGDDVVLGREVLSDRSPLPARSLRGELANDRRAVLDRIAGPHLGAGLTVPRHSQHALLDAGREARRAFVAAHVAAERIR